MAKTFAMGDGGYIPQEDIALVAWFDGGDVSIAGPALDNLKWTVKALRAVARQWPEQLEQQGACDSVPAGVMDCTAKELAVIILKQHNVIVKHDEVFPGSGLAAYHIEVSGRRRHETSWAVEVLNELADSVETDPPLCPLCGRRMNSDMAMNALSRVDNATYICNPCATGQFIQEFWGSGRD